MLSIPYIGQPLGGRIRRIIDGPPHGMHAIRYWWTKVLYATPILVLLLTNSSGSRWPGRQSTWPNNAWWDCVHSYWTRIAKSSKWRSTPALHLMIIHWGDYSGGGRCAKGQPSPRCSSPSPLLCIPVCLHDVSRLMAIIYRPLPAFFYP